MCNDGQFTFPSNLVFCFVDIYRYFSFLTLIKVPTFFKTHAGWFWSILYKEYNSSLSFAPADDYESESCIAAPLGCTNGSTATQDLLLKTWQEYVQMYLSDGGRKDDIVRSEAETSSENDI